MKGEKILFNKMLPLLMSALLTFTSIPSDMISNMTGNAMADLPMSSEASNNTYGLADNIQDGTILHCFDWTYNDIKAELQNIAEAGFTSIQTSPAQRADGDDVWYMLYQPQSFSIATNSLGSKEDLQSLCEEADKYGIKIIVDVVANHMRGDGYDVDSNMSRSGHNDYWHHDDYDSGKNIDWKNRYQVTHGRIGMYDLNSEHNEVQKIIADYVHELKSVGVDGIRWDAAKHISLPSEGCDFWSVVTQEPDMYYYGEILTGPDDRTSGNEALMKEYTDYMSVTDNGYSSNLMGNFRDGKVITDNGKWVNKNADITADKLVYWAESHDTYCNDPNTGWTKYIDQNAVDRAYAIAASRAGATALYFSRPFETAKTSIKAGVKGSTHFTSKEVAAVNHFHNAMIGEMDYYVGDTNQNVAAVCRQSGAVIVKGSGSGQVSIQNGGETTAPGTYTDEITGNTWTVTSSTISGTIGDTGIAVIYNAEPVPVKTEQ